MYRERERERELLLNIIYLFILTNYQSKGNVPLLNKLTQLSNSRIDNT